MERRVEQALKATADGTVDMAAAMRALTGDGEEGEPGLDELAQMMASLGGAGGTSGAMGGDGGGGGGGGSGGEGGEGGEGGVPDMAAILKQLSGMGEPSAKPKP